VADRRTAASLQGIVTAGIGRLGLLLLALRWKGGEWRRTDKYASILGKCKKVGGRIRVAIVSADTDWDGWETPSDRWCYFLRKKCYRSWWSRYKQVAKVSRENEIISTTGGPHVMTKTNLKSILKFRRSLQ
jgi:hypothetical protein